MAKNGFKVMDSDLHVLEPPDLWQRYIDPKFADRAPVGMIRMFVEFGVLKPAGYQPSVVRAFRLEPKPGVFTRRQIVIGWGKPDQGGTQEGVPVMVYKSGLTVYFDKDVVNAVSMWFTAPRPEAPRPKPAPKPRQ